MKRFLITASLACLIIALLPPGVGVTQAPCSLGTPYRNCPACGISQSVRGQELNVLKNRDSSADNVKVFSVDDIRRPSNNNNFYPNMAVEVTGFVASVLPGGLQETCNRKRNDLRDIHINIVAKPSEVGAERNYVVVEITPRWEKKFNLDDSNYDVSLNKRSGGLLTRGFVAIDQMDVTVITSRQCLSQLRHNGVLRV
jgi:hypothetical protein